MTAPDPAWHHLETRAAARVLQEFTCTTDHPRTPGGRRLPHNRPWEWEVQRHLRRTSELMQVGELVLAGAMHGNLVSAAHLKFEITGDIYETFIAAIGVTTTERGKGGALADLTLWKIRQEGLAQASGRGCSHLVLIGKVHTKNSSSQLMVERAGWEPYGAPLSGYQTWSRTVEVT